MIKIYAERILEKLDKIDEKLSKMETQIEVSKLKFENLEERVEESEVKLQKIDKFSVKAMTWVVLGCIGSALTFMINKFLGT